MKRSQDEENEDELHQQLELLQQDWDSFKQSSPGSIHQCSADTKSSDNILQLVDNSPRNLISSLDQRRQSLSRGGWKVRNNDLAVEEILSERRAAIESGKLKGRRLLEALDGASEMELEEREEICSGCSVLIQGRSVSSFSSDDHIDSDGSNDDQSICGHCYSSSAFSLPVENVEGEEVVVEKEKVVVVGEGQKRVGGWGGDGGRWMVVMAWLAIVLMVFALCIISLMSFDGYGDGDDETLIPT